MTNTIETTATVSEAPAAASGAVLFVPLNKLKKSPRNARKTPHSEAHIQALSASIAAKGCCKIWWWSRRRTRRASQPAAIS